MVVVYKNIVQLFNYYYLTAVCMSEVWEMPSSVARRELDCARAAAGAPLGLGSSLGRPAEPCSARNSWVLGRWGLVGTSEDGWAERVAALRKVLSPSRRRKIERGAWFFRNVCLCFLK